MEEAKCPEEISVDFKEKNGTESNHTGQENSTPQLLHSFPSTGRR
jgi:hypothetical protein